MVDHAPESISQASLSDQATDIDSLGFEPYVTAIAEFLLSEKTKPPLTLSVEGKWGSGKSSFMKQLKQYLEEKGGRTVWFNAWRHDKAEAVWAAFALSFIEQISTPKTWSEVRLSIKGYVRLLWFRFDKKNGGIELLKFGILLLFVICTAVAIPFLLLLYEIDSIEQLIKITDSSKTLGENLLSVGGFLLNTLGLTASSAGLLVASRNLMKNLFNLVKSPTKNLYQYIESPDYKKKTAFIEEFHEDFAKIVDAYIGDDNKVFVFIDDLDRCQHPKSADLMQALNLMIAEDPSVVFILGMDREKVAASLAVKYKDILTYLPREVSDLDQEILEKRAGSRGLAYGYNFIEKFVQLPFQVPQPSENDFQRFLQGLKNLKTEEEEQKRSIWGIELPNIRFLIPVINTKNQSLPADSSSQSGSVITSPQTKVVQSQESQQKALTQQRLATVKMEFDQDKDSDTVREIIMLVAPALDYNPRRVKAFINVFRLRVYIAYLTGLFDDVTDNEGEILSPAITLAQLGKFTAIGLRWPMFLLDLDKEPQLLAKLCVTQTEDETGDGIKPSIAFLYWQRHTNFMRLLTAGIGEEDSKKNCSLAELDVKKLLQVSPRIVTQINDDTQINPDFIEMVDIPAGSFMMGSNEYEREQPIHKVTVKAFQIGKYPVTQAQYEAVMRTNPSHFQGNPNHPVENVSWDDVQIFCQKLSQITGKIYRLPTEAEWEYACRAGTSTRYSFGDDKSQLGEYAWYEGNSKFQTHLVGEKKANAWGLYDMHGNVWEWCEDNYVDNYENTPRDGSAYRDKEKEYFVLRGGSCGNSTNNCRSANRLDDTRILRYDRIGFRVVCGVGRTS